MKYQSFSSTKKLLLAGILSFLFINLAQAQVPLYGTITGGNTINVTVPGNYGGTYYTGHSFIFLAVGSVSSGPVSISVNGAATRPLKKNVTQDLVAGDIVHGQAVPVIYDGVNFQIVKGENLLSNSSGISTLNGLTSTSQTFSTSSTGTSVNINSSGSTHNFNIPLVTVVGGNNVTVSGGFPNYTISGLAGGMSTSQWVSTTGGIIYSGGNVGIGNVIPNQSLTVQGNSSVTGVAYSQSLNVSQTLNQASFFATDAVGSAQNYLEFSSGRYNFNNNRTDARWQIGLNQDPTPSDNDFWGIGRNNIGYDFKINRNGFVGIGPPPFFPQVMLDVAGDARIGGVMTITSFAGNGIQSLGVNNFGQLVTIAGATSTSQWVSTTNGIYYSGGNIGLKINPQYDLHLYNPTAGVYSRFETPITTTTFNVLEFKTGIYNSTTLRSNAIWQLGMYQTGTASDPNDKMYFGRSGLSSTDFAVYRDGNVGIGLPGASVPSEKLTVLGNISASGIGYFSTIAGLALNGAAVGSIVTVDGIGRLGFGTLPSSSTSQWVSTTGGTIFYGGNVGIKSAFPPSAVLDVNGNPVFRSSPSSWNDGVNVIGASNGTKGYFIHEGPSNTANVDATTGRYFLGMVGNDPILSFIGNGFLTSSLSQPNAIAQMSTVNGGTFNVNGRIGIGTLSPATSLDVNGNARFLGPVSITGLAGATTQALGVNNLGQLVTISGASAAITSINTLTTSSQTFSTSSTGSSININSSGSNHNFNIPVVTVVGGTNVTVSGGFPTYTITGKPNTPSNWTDNGIDSYHITGGKVGVNASGTLNARFVVQGNNASNQTSGVEEVVQIGSNDNAALRLGVWMQIANLPQNRYMALNALSGTTAPGNLLLQISGGNVGIGNTIPNEKLLVQGNVSVTGTGYFGNLQVKNLIGPGTVTVDGLGNLGVTTGGGSALTGSGTANGVAFWRNGTTLTADGANFTYIPSSKSLKVGNAILSSNSALGNIFLGTNAGNQTMSGPYNNFFGSNAGLGNTSGHSNNFFGNGAGNGNTTGEFNNYFGEEAGYNNQTGNDNNSMGYQAGYGSVSASGDNNNSFGHTAGFNNEGDGNNFIGASAGYNNTSGSYNNFFGQSAGRVNTSGRDNIFIGQESGLNNSTGDNNIAIGKYAGFPVNGFNNSVAIGYNATVGGSNLMALGGSGADAVSVGIGTGLPQNTIDVVGGARIRNLSVSGAVFANASGDLYISTVAGGASNLWTVSGFNLQPTSTYGVNLTSTTTSYMIGGVDVVRYMPRGGGVGNNILLGGAGNQSMTGDGNVLIGDLAGVSNTSGSYNSFVGYGAGMSNTNGAQNTFIGRTAGRNNTSGGSNTFIGNFAGWSNVSGSSNTYNGWSAGTNNLGSGNSYFGFYSGINSTAGSDNSIFGYFADIPGSSVRSVAIGAYASVLGSNMMALGGVAGSPYAVSVGIGTGLPQNTLDVVGGARIRNLSISGAVFANTNGDLYVNTASSVNLWTVSGGILYPTNLTNGLNIGTGPGFNFQGFTGLANIFSQSTSPGLIVQTNGIGMGIISSSPTQPALYVRGQVQFETLSSTGVGYLTVDNKGTLGVSTTVGSNSAFLATSINVQNISTTGWNTLQFPTEAFDDASAYNNTTTYDFTAPSEGVYQVNASVPFANIGQVDIAITIGGSNNIIVNSVSTSPTTGVITSVPVSGIIKLTANQKVTIRVRQFTGQTQSTSSSASGANASFSMVKLY